MDTQRQIMGILSDIIGRQASSTFEGKMGPETPLYAEGLGLDSLDAAELSALLEAAFGRDPFTDGILPQTIADIVSFYSN